MMKSLLTAAFALFMFGANAQKYGFINSAEILEAMPEMKKATEELDVLSKAMQAEIQVKVDILQEDSKRFSTRINTGNISQADYEKEVARLEVAQKEISSLEAEMAKTMDAKQTELMKPIYDKLNATVKEVAAERGASAVFFSDVFAYAEDVINFTEAVKAKMGLK
ncbi:MAG: OmpH family outer membrane protein [Flavobacteriales bacterium]|nr:OmpH family outer membrane protein [Flavobacteriales bacterium]